MVNVLSNLSIFMCHAFIKEHAHMLPTIDLPLDDFIGDQSGDGANDQNEE
jgi:hypothetical protein